MKCSPIPSPSQFRKLLLVIKTQLIVKDTLIPVFQWSSALAVPYKYQERLFKNIDVQTSTHRNSDFIGYNKFEHRNVLNIPPEYSNVLGTKDIKIKKTVWSF